MTVNELELHPELAQILIADAYSIAYLGMDIDKMWITLLSTCVVYIVCFLPIILWFSSYEASNAIIYHLAFLSILGI